MTSADAPQVLSKPVSLSFRARPLIVNAHTSLTRECRPKGGLRRTRTRALAQIEQEIFYDKVIKDALVVTIPIAMGWLLVGVGLWVRAGFRQHRKSN